MEFDEPFDTRTYSEDSSSKDILESAKKTRAAREKLRKAKTQEKLAEFMSADVQDSEFGIIPEGYGGISYVTFLIFAPWITGNLFLYFYVAKGSIDAFNSIDSSTLLTWVIGYEILAAIILLIIFKKLISYLLS